MLILSFSEVTLCFVADPSDKKRIADQIHQYMLKSKSCSVGGSISSSMVGVRVILSGS